MQQELIFILIILFLVIGIILFFVYRKLSSLQDNKSNETLLEWLKSMQTSLEHTNKTLNEAMRSSSSDVTKVLQENTKQLNQRLDLAASVIRDVGKEVGQMSEIGRSMKELNEFLKNPKMRGNIGEEILKDLIAQMFPKNSFHIQYAFKSGDKVDAAIKTDAGILPIDAKFPMENFQKYLKSENQEEQNAAKKDCIKDIKKHIDAIAKKYILPDEGTMDFALMYVPSETVYYEIISLPELIEYARASRVYLVSPNTLYVHLQTILLSFEGKKMESKSKEIIRLLHALQIDYQKVEENLGILGKHLTNATSQFTNVSHGFNLLGDKLKTTRNLEPEVTKQIDK